MSHKPQDLPSGDDPSMPKGMLRDEEPPEAVDLEKIRAFNRGELDVPEDEWVAFLLTHYRSWHEASLQKDVAQPSSDSIVGPQTQLEDADDESDRIHRYLEMDYKDLIADQGFLTTTHRSGSGPLDPFLPEIERVICDEWCWAKHRSDPSLQDDVNKVQALISILRSANLAIPFELDLVASTIVKIGLDELCDIGDKRE